MTGSREEGLVHVACAMVFLCETDYIGFSFYFNEDSEGIHTAGEHNALSNALAMANQLWRHPHYGKPRPAMGGKAQVRPGQLTTGVQHYA